MVVVVVVVSACIVVVALDWFSFVSIIASSTRSLITPFFMSSSLVERTDIFLSSSEKKKYIYIFIDSSQCFAK